MTTATEERTLDQLVMDLGISSKVQQDYNDYATGWQTNANHYRVTLKYQGRTMSLWFYQGYGIEREPSVFDVVYSLISDVYYADMTLDQMIEETGAKIESVKDFRELESTHKLLTQLTKRFRHLIGSNETLELLGRAEF